MTIPAESAAPTSPALTEERPNIPGYKDLGTLGGIVRFLLLAHGVLAVATAISSAMEIALLQKIDRGQYVEAEAVANDSRQALLAVIYVLFLVGGAVLVAMWMNRTNRNIRALGSGQVEHGPNGWGWFFCPFINLVRPYHVMKELFVGSKAYDERTLSVIFPLWWGMWLASNLAGQIEMRMDVESNSAMIFSDAISILGAIAIGIAALALRRIVGEVVEAQRARAQEIARGHEPNTISIV